MPYKGDRLSMMVMLPSERDGASNLQEMLLAELIQEWRQGMTGTEEVVSMPKFEVKTEYDLKRYLIGLVMSDAL